MFSLLLQYSNSHIGTGTNRYEPFKTGRYAKYANRHRPLDRWFLGRTFQPVSYNEHMVNVGYMEHTLGNH